jgi:hypothetical protein
MKKLTAGQKAARVTISKQLLFLDHCLGRKPCDMFMIDESWVYTDNLGSSMWSGDDAVGRQEEGIITQTMFMRWICLSSPWAPEVAALPPKESFTPGFFVGEIMNHFLGTWTNKNPIVRAK